MISSDNSTTKQRSDLRPCQLKPLAKYIVDNTLDTNFHYSAFPCPNALKPTHKAMTAGGGIWDPELNKVAQYRDLIIHPNPEVQERWMGGGENKFGRLFQGFWETHGRTIDGMDVLEWMYKKDIPRDKEVTYARYTVAWRPEKLEKNRVCITAAGDRLDYLGDVATHTASLETFKLLLNSVISTEGGMMCTGDISNMYLYSSLDSFEYVRFKVELVPPAIIKLYRLQDKIHKGDIYAKVKEVFCLQVTQIVTFVRLRVGLKIQLKIQLKFNGCKRPARD